MPLLGCEATASPSNPPLTRLAFRGHRRPATRSERRRTVAIPDDGQRIPAFARIDLAAAKTWGPIELQLNLKNLLDERILTNNGGGNWDF